MPRSLGAPGHATLAAAALTIGLLSRSAKAETAATHVPATRFCALSRSAILPHVDAMPESLRCFYDEDGNGLDDDVETQLARCFVPELRFDAAERTRNGREPHTLFNVQRVPGAADELRIGFTFLYERDDGFSGNFLCNHASSHAGDTEHVNLSLRVVRGYKGYQAYVVDLDAGWPGGPSTDLEFAEDAPTRPVLYPSAGKHHAYLHPHVGAYHGSPIRCGDNAHGDGDRVVPGLSSSAGVPPALDHVPLFFGAATPSTSNTSRTIPSSTTALFGGGTNAEGGAAAGPPSSDDLQAMAQKAASTRRRMNRTLRERAALRNALRGAAR